MVKGPSEDAQEARARRSVRNHWTPIIIALILIVLLFVANLTILLLVPIRAGVSQADLQTTSLLGDGFGGLNALFSGLAFAILIGTLIYQRNDMVASEARLEAALQHQASLASTARQELEENTQQMKASMFAISEQAFVGLERSIADAPSVLRFHGITEADLERAGVTAAELSYLMATLTAGGIHIKATAIRDPSAIDSSPFPPGSYYYTLLRSPDVQKAWAVMSHVFSDSIYKTKIEATLEVLRPAAGIVPPPRNSSDVGAPESGVADVSNP